MMLSYLYEHQHPSIYNNLFCFNWRLELIKIRNSYSFILRSLFFRSGCFFLIALLPRVASRPHIISTNENSETRKQTSEIWRAVRDLVLLTADVDFFLASTMCVREFEAAAATGACYFFTSIWVHSSLQWLTATRPLKRLLRIGKTERRKEE